jgi:protein-S-isoprenylcysteine O-methyltransferase Ste14
LSIIPKKREKEKGKKAWKQCAQFRTIAGGLEFVISINIFLWIWFPISNLNWEISLNHWVGIIISIAIIIPGLIIMFKGMKDAGSETYKPSDQTKMYGGIYRYIRHPQSLGEFPIFVAFAFFVNSWFLVIVLTVFVIIYVPIMIHYEEEDLIRRFGDYYRKYQEETGALLPKINKN